MAFDGGYGAQPGYNGHPHPSQRGGYGNQPSQQYGDQYGGPQQGYDGYDDSYGYNEYENNIGHGNYDNSGYQHGYDEQYQNVGYGGAAQPRQQQQQPHHQQYSSQDYHGGHAGGAYPSRAGMGHGPGTTYPQNPPMSSHDQNYGPGAYGRDQQMVDQMAGMDINGGRQRMQPGSRGGPPQHGYPSQGPNQGHNDPRRGPNSEHYQSGYSGYDMNGRAPEPRQDHEFGPPGRSMTMPHRDDRQMPPLQRKNSMPHQDPAAQGANMPRPTTASSFKPRPPPQRQYPQSPSLQNHNHQHAQQSHHGADFSGGHNYGHGHGHGQQSMPYDNQHGGAPAAGYKAYAPGHGQKRSSVPDFEALQNNGRASFDQVMRPGPGPVPGPGQDPEQPQPGRNHLPKLSHAKSQPDLRQPQAAVFEMAGEIPSVPPMPTLKKLPQAQDQGYGGPNNYNQNQMPPRGPSAPPGPSNPSMSSQTMSSQTPRPAMPPVPPPSSDPDALPAHPTPVRAGLMENSTPAPINSKPPPVRNYGGVPQGPPPQHQHHPGAMQQRQPMRQPQQHYPQQQQQAPQAQPRQPPKPAPIPVTTQELEHLRMVIKQRPNDTETALKLAQRLIEAADVLLPKVPDPKVRGRARERYLMDAHKILKKLSNGQNSDAMFVMADALGRGLFGGSSDSKEAFTLYQSAAKLGHAGAAYRTAVCCEIGQEEGGGTRKDPMKATQWYKRSATLGDTPAMYKMGMILLKGLLGQPKNPREAIGWLKRAAERADADNPHALHELGLLYESAQPNDAILRDEQYALQLFQQAAELGYKFSQFRLGCAFEYGHMGCHVDPRMSIMWYSRAAQQEEHQSELALSGWYLTGSENVLGQSDTEAYLWARKAAVAGLAKAEYAMGYFTEVGIGVPANLEDAKRWYWRAAAQDFPKARERLEDLKRAGRNAPARQRDRISRSNPKQQEGECSIM